jgi:hypothetical protein
VERIHTGWSSDAHSTGWHTRQALKQKLEELKLLRPTLLINPSKDFNDTHVGHLIGRLEETIANLSSDVPDEDQRIVFWFDN